MSLQTPMSDECRGSPSSAYGYSALQHSKVLNINVPLKRNYDSSIKNKLSNT
jgi:hypothetical protein